MTVAQLVIRGGVKVDLTVTVADHSNHRRLRGRGGQKKMREIGPLRVLQSVGTAVLANYFTAHLAD